MMCYGMTHLAAAAGRKRRILLADDNEVDRDLYATFLSRAGYDVNTVADGEEAWNALLSTYYDLLLTDHNMPRLTGLDLVARLRTAGIILPVVINSGCLELGEAPDYPQLSLAAIVHKSAELTELLDTIACIFHSDISTESSTFWWPRGVEKQTENSSLPRLAAAPWG